MLATVLPVAVFMLILYRLWSVYHLKIQGSCRSDAAASPITVVYYKNG